MYIHTFAVSKTSNDKHVMIYTILSCIVHVYILTNIAFSALYYKLH